MNYLSTDYLIIYAFLAITLIIGLRAGRGIKDIREYAIANKTFGTGALVLTYLATNIAGASVINISSIVFSEGIIITLSLLAVSLSFVITGLLISPKFARFKKALTMGDLMQELYGDYSGMIAGGLGGLKAILLVGMELSILGIICEGLLDIPAKWGIIIGGTALSIYAAHGGMKAVTATDIFQFIMLAIFIPLIAYKAVGKIGGIPALLQQVPAQKLEVFTHKSFSYYLTFFLICLIPAGLIDPALIQRLLMAKHGEQLRKQDLIIAAIDPVFQIAIMFIGLSAVVLYPHIKGEQVVFHLIHELLPVGLKGCAMAGILAVGMSTIDSYLHAAGLTLAHDIIKPICDKKNIPINELRWARYMTVIIGLIGIVIGLGTTDILGLAFSALEFVSPLLMFPLFAGIMGLKTDQRSFYTALVVTLVAFVIAKLALPEKQAHLSVLITMAANGITFFGTHVFQNKGFAIQKANGEQAIWQPSKKNSISILKVFIPTPKRIIRYSQNKVAQYGTPYVLFGVLMLINYTLPYFIWMQTPAQYETPMLYLRVIGAVCCVLLIVREQWPNWLLPILPTFWHLTVLYCLPLTSTVMFLFTGASVAWIVNIFGIIILLLVLLDWFTALILTILGISLGLVFYQLVTGTLSVPINFSTQYLTVYQGIFGIIIGLIFARSRQKSFDSLTCEHRSLQINHQENKEAYLENFKEKIRLLKTLKKAGIKDLAQVVQLIKILDKKSQNKGLPKQQSFNTLLQQIKDTIIPMAVTLERIENRATDYLRLDSQPIAFENLLEAVQAQLPDQPLSFQLSAQQQQIVCDPTRIKQLLVHSIRALQPDTKQKPLIYISCDDTKLTYPLASLSKAGKDYIKKIDAIALTISSHHTPEPIEKSYQAQMGDANWPIPESTQDLLRFTNQKIVKAHYGYTNVELSQPTPYNSYLYIIPARLTEIRPRDMNDPYMELGAELMRADDTYPGAVELEAAFLNDVEKLSNASVKNIKAAIELIKWYHGPKKRHSGEPFYLHPMAVAQIALSFSADEATIIGALLHDTVEDTAMLLESVDMMFGPEVVHIVDGVTHFESTKESFYKIRLSKHENLLLLLEVQDQRALYVKIADRMHNMRTINGHRNEDKKRRIADETLQFFVPLSRALGLKQASEELKARSKTILYELVQKDLED